jgi:hypothetical protein
MSDIRQMSVAMQRFVDFISTVTNSPLLRYAKKKKHNDYSNPFPWQIESLAHDSGRILECAEYGYPKCTPNTNS